MSNFRLEDHPVVLLKPRLSYPYAWVGHIPFAYLLVDLLRPRLLVELGTDSGNSYLAFCQAVVEVGASTQCVAVDSWEGDPHARRYGASVFETLRRYHDPRYTAFSRLHKGYFNDAVKTFDDGTIDLLHIDGLHTYEAVAEDFNTWLPKLSDRAVVIFHDSQVHSRGFGVAQFLSELKEKYRIAEFEHSNGLGIALVGTHVPDAFVEFMDAFDTRPQSIRGFFSDLGEALTASGQGAGVRSEQVEPGITCRVYYREAAETFDDARSAIAELVDPLGLQALEFDLPNNVRPDFIRLDPADHPGVFEITDLSLYVGDEVIHIPDVISRVSLVSGDIVDAKRPLHARLVSFSDDPHLELAIGDFMHLLPSEGALKLKVTLDYQVVINIPSLWSLAQAQDAVLQQVKAKLEREKTSLALPPAPQPTLQLGDVATVIGAMHVAGAVLVPGAGPAVYTRSHGSPYVTDRRVIGNIVGLGEAAEFTFDLTSQDGTKFMRLDVPAMAGSYKMLDLFVDGQKLGRLSSRIVPVDGTLIIDSSESTFVMAAIDRAPSVELDISDIDSAKSFSVKIVREARAPWLDLQGTKLFDHLHDRDLKLSARIEQLSAAVEQQTALSLQQMALLGQQALLAQRQASRLEALSKGVDEQASRLEALSSGFDQQSNELRALAEFERGRGVIPRLRRRFKRNKPL